MRVSEGDRDTSTRRRRHRVKFSEFKRIPAHNAHTYYYTHNITVYIHVSFGVCMFLRFSKVCFLTTTCQKMNAPPGVFCGEKI